jgi:hypothetical protein
MKKTVIANIGHANQGKSDSIKKVLQLLLLKYPNSNTPLAKIDYSGDVKVIISIRNLKIGIESQGDPNSRLGKSLDEFAAESCDIIICSCRTRGQTAYDVDSMKPQYGYDIIWVSNYRSDEVDKDNLNELSAKQFVELVEGLFNNDFTE